MRFDTYYCVLQKNAFIPYAMSILEDPGYYHFFKDLY